ncbi:MAG TPA: hypothetical protein VFX61_23570, partial [Micromonosporaceae bacterium]|nr:hypothetical protein [Micromonosporaceae bacterium]
MTDGAPPTDPAPGPRDALEPWPETVNWRGVSHDLIWVELLHLAGGLSVALIGVAIAWAATGHWAFGAGLGVVVTFGLWRATVTVRAVRAWGYAERDKDL